MTFEDAHQDFIQEPVFPIENIDPRRRHFTVKKKRHARLGHGGEHIVHFGKIGDPRV